MILYTICDIESVLDTSINVASPLENGVVGGVPVVLRRESGGAAFIDRVLSTNPTDYLRPELTPGTPVIFDTGSVLPPEGTVS